MFSLYRLLRSYLTLPLLALGIPDHACRFTPTCSYYCQQALRQHGLSRGMPLCIKRLLRCRPGVPAGFDPVPPS